MASTHTKKEEKKNANHQREREKKSALQNLRFAGGDSSGIISNENKCEARERSSERQSLIKK